MMWFVLKSTYTASWRHTSLREMVRGLCLCSKASICGAVFNDNILAALPLAGQTLQGALQVALQPLNHQIAGLSTGVGNLVAQLTILESKVTNMDHRLTRVYQTSLRVSLATDDSWNHTDVKGVRSSIDNVITALDKTITQYHSTMVRIPSKTM